MNDGANPLHHRNSPSPPGPTDDFLIQSMLGGDGAALGKLIDRYDRLVRHTIFRVARSQCLRDPHFLESIASATWTGLVRSLQRPDATAPASLSAYLIQIARNQTTSELRRVGSSRRIETVDISAVETDLPATNEEPAEIAANAELLEALRTCMEQLDDTERETVTQLTAITERRWRQAATALGIAESTIRSRWSRILERLRACVREKTGESLAPLPGMSDPSSGDPKTGSTRSAHGE